MKITWKKVGIVLYAVYVGLVSWAGWEAWKLPPQEEWIHRAEIWLPDEYVENKRALQEGYSPYREISVDSFRQFASCMDEILVTVCRNEDDEQQEPCGKLLYWTKTEDSYVWAGVSYPSTEHGMYIKSVSLQDGVLIVRLDKGWVLYYGSIIYLAFLGYFPGVCIVWWKIIDRGENGGENV